MKKELCRLWKSSTVTMQLFDIVSCRARSPAFGRWGRGYEIDHLMSIKFKFYWKSWTFIIFEFLLFSCSSDPHEYSTFLRSRPDIMELEAIRVVTRLCLQYQYVMMRPLRVIKSSTFDYLMTPLRPRNVRSAVLFLLSECDATLCTCHQPSLWSSLGQQDWLELRWLWRPPITTSAWRQKTSRHGPLSSNAAHRYETQPTRYQRNDHKPHSASHFTRFCQNCTKTEILKNTQTFPPMQLQLMGTGVFKLQKGCKSSTIKLSCTIFQAFWNHTIALGEKQTEIYIDNWSFPLQWAVRSVPFTSECRRGLIH